MFSLKVSWKHGNVSLTKDCFCHGNGCILNEAIDCELSCKSQVFESLLLKKDYPKMQMIVDSWQHILFRQKWKYFCRQRISTVSIESIFWWFWMLLQLQKLLLNVLYVKWTSYWCWREYIDQNETNMDTNECKWRSKGVLIRLFLHVGWKPNQRLCYLW